MKTAKVLILAWTGLFFAVAICNAAPIYTITDLGTLDGPYSGASSINNNGQIVGDAQSPSGQRATLFDATGSVPEPSSMVCLVVGGLAVFIFKRRRKHK